MRIARGCKAALIAAALALTVPMPANSYELEPIIVQLAPSGSGAVHTMTIANTHDVPIAIEISVYRRFQKPDGTETREIEDDDVLVTPPQMVIAPGSSQSFKVRWIGRPDIVEEQTYRIVTEQLPIRLREESRDDFSAKVSMRYRYEAALYIMPAKRDPQYRLLSARPVEDAGARFVEVDIASEGNMRAILQQPRLTLTANGSRSVIEGETAGELEGLNILAGNHRIVRLPWPQDLPFGEVEASLDARLLVLQ